MSVKLDAIAWRKVYSDPITEGLLRHYLEQSKTADLNVERRLAREPFDFRDLVQKDRKRK